LGARIPPGEAFYTVVRIPPLVLTCLAFHSILLGAGDVGAERIGLPPTPK